jgi:hypothetical protein
MGRISNKELADVLERVRYKVAHCGVYGLVGYTSYAGALRRAILVLRRHGEEFSDVYERRGKEGLTEIKGIGDFSASVIEMVLQGKNERDISRYIKSMV